MKPAEFPPDLQPHLIPAPTGDLVYQCLECGKEYDIRELLYTCPACRGLFLLIDRNEARLQERPGAFWRRLFDYRKMLNLQVLKGIFLYYELIAPVIPLKDIIYLGEGHTPQVAANDDLQGEVGAAFYFKNDGQNPSASFKDRGMAAALSFINYLAGQGAGRILAICASTGDTSAAAALYSAYLGDRVASAVLLPYGKVTPQQLAQPLGSGARVLELPGVFDDCMKVVEHLADNYRVALLNSKNSWRIRGQESYAYEIAQWFDYDLINKAVVVPIGNAGNITAVMQGFLRLHDFGIIENLPRILGVQSRHANPVFKYYAQKDKSKRVFVPVTVTPSVAQAAMIGNPVSMPRVIRLAEEYTRRAGDGAVAVVEVTEQEIMDSMLLANRHGHIACTQGGESLAGYRAALKGGVVGRDEVAVLDATAHHLKFISFQEMYFQGSFHPDFEVIPKPEYQNRPQLITSGKEDYQERIADLALQIATLLDLTPKG